MKTRNLIRHLLAVILAAFLASSAGLAQDEPALDARKAGIDAVIQGDYAGMLAVGDELKPFAVQVRAIGDGKFKARLFKGGLPGDGWDKEKPEEFDGKVDGEFGVFKCSLGACTVKNAVMIIEQMAGGDFIPVGEMQRTIRESKTLGMKAPEGADVLLDSEDKDFAEASLENWVGAKEGEPAKLDEEMLCPGANSKATFQDHILHVEFLLPFMPKAEGQARGNSGVYLQGRYEVQILDSYGLEGKDNECGGLYTIKAPEVNMCYPPLQWQTYDIKFTAAKFDEAGKKTANAKITVLHNGVRIHHNVELPKVTTAAPNAEGPEPGFLHLQDHGNPVRFKNIWVLDLSKKKVPEPATPEASDTPR